MADLDFQRVDGVAQPERLKQLSCLEALRERRGDVRCFTPALLITHAYLPVDPAQDFAARFPAAKALQPFCVELPANAPPFFSGLPATVLNGQLIDWNRRLYAIAAERAKDCFDFLAGIGVSGNNEFFASSVMYEFKLPDPLSRLSIRDTIDLTGFGVFSSNKITYLAPRFNLPPIVRTIPAEKRLDAALGFNVDEIIESDFKQHKREE
jgi:hypothetical protein